jgi:site-specific DNA recombinase
LLLESWRPNDQCGRSRSYTAHIHEFAAGKSPRRIAFALNAGAIPAPGGAGWGASTINGNAARGTGILNNELYIGRLVWNRLRYIKDPRTGKRISRLNAENDQVVHDAPALRIVEQKIWDAVKARRKTLAKDTRPDCREERPFWARTRPKYMFSGLMRCDMCGGAYTKISANLFGCATARNKGTCRNRLNIRRDVLVATVLDGLKNRLMDPSLYRIFIDEFIRETNRLRSNESSKPDRAKADLAAVERRLRKIVDAIADGVPARTLKDELMALEARQDELRTMLTEPAPNKPLLHPNLAELYRRKVADLAAALEQPGTREEAFLILRSLVETVHLVPDNGALRVEIRGELAGILALADSKKLAANIRDGLEQIKVVAGARIGRDRHSLATPMRASFEPRKTSLSS